MNIEINPKSVFKILLIIIVTLILLNLAGIIAAVYLNHDYIYGLVPLFNLDTERNIPTIYSALCLLASSLLLLTITVFKKSNDANYKPWLGLSLIFLFLSFDEAFVVHEKLVIVTRETLNTSGLLYFAWVIPYGFILAIFVLVYLKFLKNLPRKTAILFIISGIIYVSGAIGVELLGGRHYELYKADIIYGLLYTCEESLEMLGIAAFIYSLLTYMADQIGSITMTFTKAKMHDT